MSFGDHLEELRRRVLWALAAPIPLSVVVFVFKKPLIEWLCAPLMRVLEANELPRRMLVLGPAEALMTAIKLSLIGAVVLSAPWILLQGWKFIKPGLYHHERRFVHFLLPGSAILTAAGVSLLYYIMLPLMLAVLVKFGSGLLPTPGDSPQDPRVQSILESLDAVPIRINPPNPAEPGDAWLTWPDLELYVAVPRNTESDTTNPQTNGDAQTTVEIIHVAGRPLSQEFRLGAYLDFVMLLILAISIAFQMPLVILLLGWVGIVRIETLRTKRKYALFICGAIGAVITPPDALSMLMMLVPLYGLYELGIILLVLAPAQAVAEGSVLSWRRSHKSPDEAEQDGEPSQTKRPTDRTAPDGESSHPEADEPEDRS
ncbi:MAG: preprotein translocase subunit TatC [Gemmatimonadetes bacterium]|nr:preprotein translocase subunit TatC [Gemmatimonadota bacterium]